MKTKTKQPAFAYVRVSSRGQAQNDKQGLPVQRRVIQAYAQQHGFDIVQVFEEVVTGTVDDPLKRRAFTAMLTALVKTKIAHVLVYSLDRIARDLRVYTTLEYQLQKQGVELISVAQPLSDDADERDTFSKLLGLMAHLDRKFIVRRLRQGRELKRQRDGYCEGAKPYGFYDNEKGTLSLIRQLRQQGMKYSAITRELNARGILSRHGKAWRDFSVNNILRRDAAARRRKRAAA